MPLAVKIPLLMSAILLVVMGVALLATYTSLRDSSLDRARQRLVRATRQLAASAVASMATTTERYASAARDSLVIRALRGARVDARPVLEAIARASGDSTLNMPVELWSASGRRVALVGSDVPAVMRRLPGQSPLPDRITAALDPGSSDQGDSLRGSPLYLEGEHTYFWFVFPVRENNRALGYITHQRRITPSVRAAAILRDVSGDSMSVYYRNVDGSFWSQRAGAPMSPLVNVDSLTAMATGANGEDVLFAEERIGSTPWIVGVTMTVDWALSRDEPVFGRMVWLSIVLLGGGATAAWLIGRRVSRPLAQFTRAAEALARGDYSARVPTDGDPEVRRLGESLNHMAAEIDASRQALEQQTREARAANNAKSEFLTMMSHELRTPLNAIGGYVELLEMELRGPLTPAQRRDLERIKASQQHLLGLISGVLDLARVESGKVAYDMEDLALDPFLSGLDALIEPQAAAKHIVLDYVPCETDLAVRADREKLRQILLNLLSNAIRHTPAGGRVTLSASPVDMRVRIAVEDTGPGIPADKREEIFEPFVQLDRTLTQPREGLGLGLAISRDLARGMAGDLAVDPATPSGARFVLTLHRGATAGARSLMQSGEVPAVH